MYMPHQVATNMSTSPHHPVTPTLQVCQTPLRQHITHNLPNMSHPIPNISNPPSPDQHVTPIVSIRQPLSPPTCATPPTNIFHPLNPTCHAPSTQHVPSTPQTCPAHSPNMSHQVNTNISNSLPHITHPSTNMSHPHSPTNMSNHIPRTCPTPLLRHVTSSPNTSPTSSPKSTHHPFPCHIPVQIAYICGMVCV